MQKWLCFSGVIKIAGFIPQNEILNERNTGGNMLAKLLIFI